MDLSFSLRQFLCQSLLKSSIAGSIACHWQHGESRNSRTQLTFACLPPCLPALHSRQCVQQAAQQLPTSCPSRILTKQTGQQESPADAGSCAAAWLVCREGAAVKHLWLSHADPKLQCQSDESLKVVCVWRWPTQRTLFGKCPAVSNMLFHSPVSCRWQEQGKSALSAWRGGLCSCAPTSQ